MFLCFFVANSFPALFPNHSSRVFLVFLADEFQKLGIGLQSQIHVHLPRFCIRFRIVDCHFHIHVSKVSAPEPFGQMKTFGRWVPRLIQPKLTVCAGCLDNEGVALPLPNRESLPGGPIDDLWKRAAIAEDLPERGSGFVKNQGQSWYLNNLERSDQRGFLRQAGRQAARARVIFGMVRLAFFEHLSGPWLKRNRIAFLQALSDVEHRACR